MKCSLCSLLNFPNDFQYRYPKAMYYRRPLTRNKDTNEPSIFTLSFKIIKFLASFPFVLEISLYKIRHVSVTVRNILCDTDCRPSRHSTSVSVISGLLLQLQNGNVSIYSNKPSCSINDAKRHKCLKRFITLSSRNVNCVYVIFIS